MTVFNKSKIKFFEGSILSKLEQEVNDFINNTTRIYNVKHNVTDLSEDGYIMKYHYIMVSYE